MTLNANQANIVAMLKNSRHSVTAKEITERYGISARQIRYEIADLRYKGYIIDSGPYGYRLAKTRNEAERCISRLKASAKSIDEIAEIMSVYSASLPAERI
jgi:predicted DNA-binding transcriptional regulator YafY